MFTPTPSICILERLISTEVSVGRDFCTELFQSLPLLHHMTSMDLPSARQTSQNVTSCSILTVHECQEQAKVWKMDVSGWIHQSARRFWKELIVLVDFDHLLSVWRYSPLSSRLTALFSPVILRQKTLVLSLTLTEFQDQGGGQPQGYGLTCHKADPKPQHEGRI